MFWIQQDAYLGFMSSGTFQTQPPVSFSRLAPETVSTEGLNSQDGEHLSGDAVDRTTHFGQNVPGVVLDKRLDQRRFSYSWRSLNESDATHQNHEMRPSCPAESAPTPRGILEAALGAHHNGDHNRGRFLRCIGSVN